MCIKITFPPTDEQIAQAQWALVYTLEATITSSWRRSRDARQSLHEALRHAREQTDSSQQWAVVFVQTLLDTISTLQSAARRTASITAAQIERPQSDIVDALEERVEELTRSQGHLLMELIERDTRIAELEESLRLTQGKHRREIDERRREVSNLQATIADLNRIIAAQQEQLDALRQ